jgi:hypothetical protein
MDATFLTKDHRKFSLGNPRRVASSKLGLVTKRGISQRASRGHCPLNDMTATSHSGKAYHSVPERWVRASLTMTRRASTSQHEEGNTRKQETELEAIHTNLRPALIPRRYSGGTIRLCCAVPRDQCRQCGVSARKGQNHSIVHVRLHVRAVRRTGRYYFPSLLSLLPGRGLPFSNVFSSRILGGAGPSGGYTT